MSQSMPGQEAAVSRNIRVPWTVRASRTNLANVRKPGEEGADEPEAVEQVRLQIWPALHTAPVVIK
ncbi:hypothetical protein ABIA32_000377 [Streptacidiphilus sp. MAP12-20]|uniref:hypothetical protein n=1 Tax=Streptacidiphilus sp. MAP12-20 TaxID=3156299 RepID=UPI003511DBF3